MKITKSFIKVTVQCVKDNKEMKIGLTHEVLWDNDFNHVTEVRMVHEMLMNIEDQGYSIKDGTSPQLQVTVVPEKNAEVKAEREDSTPLKAIDDAFDKLFEGNEAIQQLEKKTEQPPVNASKKSKFRI